MRAPNWHSIRTLFPSLNPLPRQRRRYRTSLPISAEVLEYRLCLSAAPVIASLTLQNDTGQAGDGITEDPTLSGSITNDDNTNQVSIEIDINADGVADDWVYPEADGTFVVDPANHVSFGELTIKVRAVEMVFENSETLFSEWASITFTYEAPPNDPPSIASLSLLSDTGTAGDNITEDPTLIGSLLNDGMFDSMSLEIDYNGDGVADDWVYPEGDGTFAIDPTNYVTFGEVTIAVRAVEMDMNSAETLFGDWSSITFTYEAPPNDPPSIVSLSLQNDTGEPGDNITQDPTLIGAVINDGAFDQMSIEVDYNGDGFGDDWVYPNADGTFEIDPGALIGPGQVTISVRAVEWGVASSEYTFSDWVTITFTFDDSSASSSSSSSSSGS